MNKDNSQVFNVALLQQRIDELQKLHLPKDRPPDKWDYAIARAIRRVHLKIDWHVDILRMTSEYASVPIMFEGGPTTGLCEYLKRLGYDKTVSRRLMGVNGMLTDGHIHILDHSGLVKPGHRVDDDLIAAFGYALMASRKEPEAKLRIPQWRRWIQKIKELLIR